MTPTIVAMQPVTMTVDNQCKVFVGRRGGLTVKTPFHPIGVDGMANPMTSRPSRMFGSRRGLAAPVSMLIILFSLTLVSTVVYSISMKQIGNRKEDLKLLAAEEKMLSMEEAISAVAWSPGGSRTLVFSNYGGQLRVEPDENHLTLTIAMGNTTVTVFDSDTGRFVYELPSTVVGHYGVWLRGDSRSIVNRSSAYQAQMVVEKGNSYEELVAGYRPLASSSEGNLVLDRRVNNVRIYVVNLNASQPLQSSGEFHMRVVCFNVLSQAHSYNLSSSVTTLVLTAVLGDDEDAIVVPLIVGPSGSTVKLEVVVSSVVIEEVRV